MKKNPRYKRLARNSGFMIIRMILVLVISFYTSRLVLDILGVSDYGVYNLVAGFVAMFGFLNASLTNGIQRFYNFELGRHGIEGANAVLNGAILIQLLLALVILFPAEMIGSWYIENKMVLPAERIPAAKLLFHFSLLTFILHIVQVPFSAAIIAHEKMGFYALGSILQTFLTLGFVLLLKSLDVDYLILYGFIISFVALIVLMMNVIYCKCQFVEAYINLKSIRKRKLIEMMSFSGWNLFGTCGQILKEQGVNLLLNMFFGPVVNAARGIANQVSSGVTSFVMNISIPANPQIVQSYAANEKERSISLMLFISKICVCILAAIALPVMLEADFLLRIWLGKNVPAHTAYFVIILLLNAFISTLNSSISTIVHASGKMRLYQLSGGSFSFVSVAVVCIALLCDASPEIALLTIPMTDCLRQVAAVIILHRLEPLFGIGRYLKDVVLPFTLVAISTLGTLILFRQLLDEGFLRLIAVSAASAIFTCIYTYMLGLSKSEKGGVRQAIIARKFKQVR